MNKHLRAQPNCARSYLLNNFNMLKNKCEKFLQKSLHIKRYVLPLQAEMKDKQLALQIVEAANQR